MATAAASKVEKVYGAIAKVLAELSVEKNGTLPGSMGGKSYITAVDLSASIKTLFVEHNLIVLPNERYTKHEVQESKGRTQVIIGCEGEYTIVHIEDGSKAVVQGIGDGLATGTAVASNIASTNAMKNALLRTFLVTEQSSEDQAKNGIDESPAKSTSAKPAGASQAPSKPSGRPSHVEVVVDTASGEVKELGVAELQALVKKEAPESFGAIGGELAAAKKFPVEGNAWSTDAESLSTLLDTIRERA